MNQSLIALLGLSLTVLVAAADIEEIVVTAELTDRSDMDTLSSVTVIDATTSALFNSTHLEGLLNFAPNLNFAGGTNRARFFQIRGIGERSQYSAPLNPSVGLMIDGIDFSGMGTIAHLMDVNQVEVLRGPQGTGFGANGLAGLIAITSQDPLTTSSASVRMSLGNFNHRRLAGVLNQPISEKTQVRLAMTRERADGYYDNAYLNRSDTNGIDESHIRLKIKNEGDRHKARITVLHAEVDNGFDAFSLDNSRTTLSDEPGYDQQKTNAIAGTLSIQTTVGEITLAGSTSRSDIGYGYDEDWSYAGIHPFGYQSTDEYLRDRDHQTLEARLHAPASTGSDDSTLSWTVGIYHTDQATRLERRYTFAEGPYRSRFDNQAAALFGEVDVSFSPNFGGLIGGRIERRTRRFSDSNAMQFSPEETLWGGRIGIYYRLMPDLKSYMSISRGFKAGGFNTDGSLPFELLEFADESLIETELGLKGQFTSTRLKLALFYSDRKDQQVKSALVIPRNDGSTAFIDFLGNAAEGVNQGFELEIDHAFSEAFTLKLAAAYLQAKFREFINEFGEDLGGRDQAQAPNYTAHLGLNYQRGGWQSSVAVDAKDGFFFSDRHAARSKAFTTINLGVGWSSERWSIQFWGKNLTDETIRTRGFGSFGNDPRKNYVTEPYYSFAAPRSVGLTLTAHWGE